MGLFLVIVFFRQTLVRLSPSWVAFVLNGQKGRSCHHRKILHEIDPRFPHQQACMRRNRHYSKQEVEKPNCWIRYTSYEAYSSWSSQRYLPSTKRSLKLMPPLKRCSKFLILVTFQFK